MKHPWHLHGTSGNHRVQSGILTEVFYIFKIPIEFWIEYFKFLYFVGPPGTLLYNKLQQQSSSGISESRGSFFFFTCIKCCQTSINGVKIHQTRDHTASLWEAVLHFTGQVANRETVKERCPNVPSKGTLHCSAFLLPGSMSLNSATSHYHHRLGTMPSICEHLDNIQDTNHSRHVDLPGLGACSRWVYFIENNNMSWSELYNIFPLKF